MSKGKLDGDGSSRWEVEVKSERNDLKYHAKDPTVWISPHGNVDLLALSSFRISIHA